MGQVSSRRGGEHSVSTARALPAAREGQTERAPPRTSVAPTHKALSIHHTQVVLVGTSFPYTHVLGA